MQFDRRHFLASTLALSTGACASTKSAWPATSVAPQLPVIPLQISETRLDRITVCTRPFRPGGPRIDIEKLDEKTVVHNYGHGGSGWSLSWACADEAVELVKNTEASEVAVIGAGVIGLTTATRLAQSGIKVTIYAAELPDETRSARATGVWSPSSRIGLKSAVPSDFETRWEAWARASYTTHEAYRTAPAAPIETVLFYSLRNSGPRNRPDERHDFLHIGGRLSDLSPGNRTLMDHEHRFPVESVRMRPDMAFNIAAYTRQLVDDLQGLGVQIVQQSFQDRGEALRLAEPVLVNCTGYGAKALWGADELVPVRGQINWMPAQPNAGYGLYFQDVYVLSRGDGLVVQYTGPTDDYGYGINDETPDPDEMRRAVRTVAPLFEGWQV